MSALLLGLVLAAPGRAAAPGSAAAPSCEGDAAAWIARLEAAPDVQAYLCLADTPAAYDPLMAAIDSPAAQETNVAHRLTRALTLHLMNELDRVLTEPELRALNPDDRRLLKDAVHARRGRRTPSPDHAKVFEQLAWYQPDDHYNNGRLTEVDRANVALLDAPPAPPTPAATASAAEGVAQAQGPASPTGLCGCSAGGGLSAPWLLGLLALVRRRRHGRRQGRPPEAGQRAG